MTLKHPLWILLLSTVLALGGETPIGDPMPDEGGILITADAEPKAPADLPRRNCTRLDLKMTLLDAEVALRDVVGYGTIDFSTNVFGIERRVEGYLEPALTFSWALEYNSPHVDGAVATAEAVKLAYENSQLAYLATIRRADAEDLETARELVLNASCHAAAALSEIRRALENLAALPDNVRKANADRVKYLVQDLSASEKMVSYALRVLEHQLDACTELNPAVRP